MKNEIKILEAIVSNWKWKIKSGIHIKQSDKKIVMGLCSILYELVKNQEEL